MRGDPKDRPRLTVAAVTEHARRVTEVERAWYEPREVSAASLEGMASSGSPLRFRRDDPPVLTFSRSAEGEADD